MKVSIKHAGKVHEGLELDPTKPGSVFKQTVYEKTGVPPDRMKVMIKGALILLLDLHPLCSPLKCVSL